jgi:hypothetical protein
MRNHPCTLSCRSSRRWLPILILILCNSLAVNAQLAAGSTNAMLHTFYDSVSKGKVPVGQKEFRIGKKSVIIYGTRHDRRDLNDVQFHDMQRIILSQKPTVIFTESNSYASSDLQETIKNYGDASFCRYMAYQQKVDINNWDLYWGMVYYEMAKTYRSDDIFTVLLGNLFDVYMPWPGSDFNSFYRDFVSMLESVGYPVSLTQRQPQYFLEQYEKFYRIAFDKRFSKEGQDKLIKKRDKGIDKEIMSLFFIFRDQNLIRVIKNALKSNDRIFIQAGCVHRASMESVLETALREPDPEINKYDLHDFFKQDFKRPDAQWDSLGSFSKEIRIGNKIITIWASDKRVDFQNDTVILKMEKLIKKFSPSLILTENYKKIYNTSSETYHKSGESGLVRTIAQKKKIPLIAWGRYLSYPYYQLSAEYRESDVINGIIFYQLKKGLGAYKNNFDTFQDFYFSNIFQQILYEGFPQREDQINFDALFHRCLEQLPEISSNGVLLDIDPILYSKKNSVIVKRFKQYRSEDIVKSLEVGLQGHNRIFLEADKEVLKTLFTNGQISN